MAILRVNSLGTTNNTGTGLSSLTMTVTATTTAHNRIIVPCFWGSSDKTAAVTDSQGNTYIQDMAVPTLSSAGWGRVFSARGDIPLVSGVDTIKLTWTGGTVNDAMMAAYEYSGMANFLPVDVTQATYGGGGGSISSGNATTNFANELVFGFIGWGSTGNITAHSYTQLDRLTGGSHSLETQENIVSATGTFAATATLAGSVAWVAMLVTYSDTVNTAAGVLVNSTLPTITGSGALGMQLTCSQGSWVGIPTAYAYQWKRDGSNIATGAHYLVSSADVGHVLSCVVSASNKYGPVTATAPNTVTPAVNKAQIGLGI